ncbi:protein MLN51 homolog isoform X5 [Vitis vinifera]|uniref:protein MLN51 homolog isoform X5 n=1 Tax=Vitis vinifera TaxID=29760 RepID=UPI0028830855|nr:protein MLN51 homolog isoform X5 [Vitis vinifera]XP_059596751.1 protein MLN51 homolog isoform X5 [Vitis vinifera]
MEGEEDALNENDSDDSMLPMARRRREASDEDDDGSEFEDRARSRTVDRSARFGSGNESDGLSEAQLSDNDEESYTEEEEVDEVEVLVELPESDAERTGLHGEDKRNEEKMNLEPFLVPKFGSFYLHDDRSRDTGGRGRRRRVVSGSKLWETKDEQKWGHDKFEEMMQQERQHQESNVRRISSDRSQGNSKSQGHGSGNVKGTRYRPHENSDNQNKSSKVVRGRGPIRYKSLTRSKNIIPSTKSKQSGQSLETTSNTNSERVLLHTSDSQSVPLARMKCVAASSSSSAWLYPDGSTSHLSVAQKWDAKPGGTSGCQLMSVLLDENFAVSKPGVFQQRNTLAHPVDPNPFRFKSVHPVGGHCLTNLPSHSSVSLSTDTGGSPLSLDQGWHPSVQPRPLQGTVQPPLWGPVQKSSQHSEFGSQASSEVLAVNSSESGALVSLPGGKSKHALDGKGTVIVEGNKRGNLYRRGGQNFPATPGNFPVMQFGDQHHGGLGFPPVCTCLTCYSSLSEHGFGNSDIAWQRAQTWLVVAEYLQMNLDMKFGNKNSNLTDIQR